MNAGTGVAGGGDGTVSVGDGRVLDRTEASVGPGPTDVHAERTSATIDAPALNARGMLT
jgi:hypothetical protein